MPLPIPNLDDRSWQDLRDAAMENIKTNLDTNWNDLSPGDPGVVLLEAFAFITEEMIFKLNRLPRKVYVAFLRLLGVSLYPPTAAMVKVKFWTISEITKPITIPCGQPLTMSTYEGADEPPLFVTTKEIEVKPEHTVENPMAVEARHCQLVKEERLGNSSGKAGQIFELENKPIVASMNNSIDLKVGVEVDPSEYKEHDWITDDGKHFHIWREVETFTNFNENDRVYIVDRQLGLIQFAPEARLKNVEEKKSKPTHKKPPLKAFAAIPSKGKEIRVSYSWGGGESGNIAEKTLDAFADVPNQKIIEGVALINDKRAVGGGDAESIENALRRGPYQVHSLERAVTARDFVELTLHKSKAILRAKAYAKLEVWQHAQPGTVAVVLMPRPTQANGKNITAELLAEDQNPAVMLDIQSELKERSPLGTRVELNWARYKKVKVTAEVLVSRSASPSDVRDRITENLNQIISPLPYKALQNLFQTPSKNQRLEKKKSRRLEDVFENGWPFGRSLRLTDISRFILAADGNVSHISSLALHVTDAPNKNVHAVAADYFQPNTWYAASGNRLLRSVNDGVGWELMIDFSTSGEENTAASISDADSSHSVPQMNELAETIRLVKPSPYQPGIVTMTTEIVQADGSYLSPLYFSNDCGDSWQKLIDNFKCEIEDMAWLNLSGRHTLLLATSKGLNEVDITLSRQNEPQDASVALIPVLASKPDHPVYALTVIEGKRGNAGVAVALKHRRGVFISDSLYLVRTENTNMESETAVAETTNQSTQTSSYRYLGLRGEDIRHLNVQYLSSRIFLWAGAMAQADDGQGCYRWQIDDIKNTIDGEWISTGWKGGSCHALTFLKPIIAATEAGQAQNETKALILAVSAWGGVQTAEYNPASNDPKLEWQPLQHQELPLRGAQLSNERDFFVPIITIASNTNVKDLTHQTVMVGGEKGVYRSLDRGKHYEHISKTIFENIKDVITIPQDMLLISDRHEIEVNEDNEIPQEIGSLDDEQEAGDSGEVEHGTA